MISVPNSNKELFMTAEFTNEELEIVILALENYETRMESLSETKAAKIRAIIEKLYASKN
jgi:c-di-AMP phosphodiesterase-like protein